MTYLRPGIALLMTVALIGLPTPAHAGQLNAGDAPRVAGPLTRADKDCQSDKTTSEDGDLAGTLKSCVFFYVFDSSAESDDAHNYGVVWIQSNVDAAAGWCTDGFRYTVDVPSNTTLTALQPRGVTQVGSPKRVKTRLRVDAAGNASDPGKINQGFRLYPNELHSRTTNQKRNVRLRWNGSTSQELAFASGFELRWTQGSSPDLNVVLVLNGDFEQKQNC